MVPLRSRSFRPVIAAVVATLMVAGCQREKEIAAFTPPAIGEKARLIAPVAHPVVERIDLKRISLVGVTFRGPVRSALISIDGHEPQTLPIGADILGAELNAIEPEYVVLLESGKRVTVRMVGAPMPASIASATTRPPSPIEPMSGGLVNAQSAGAGNAAFLDAVEKAGQRAHHRD